MLKSGRVNSIRNASGLKSIVLGLLVTCLLLSTCAVRKSIEAFLQGSVRTESPIANGFKKIRAIAANAQAGNPQLCSAREQATFQSIDLKDARGLYLLLPQALFLSTLLGFIAAGLLSLLYTRFAVFYPKALFALSGTPIYIKNRLLLI